MKSHVLVYIVVAVLSVGAGVAIAGTPNSIPREATIVVPETTEPPLPASTAPPATQAPTTEPPPTDPPATDVSVETVPSTTTPPSTSTTSTAPEETTTTVEPLPERADVNVSVANGANVGGSASRTSAALEELGYVDVGSFDGSDIVEFTVVYAADGSQGAADRISGELGIAPGLVFPIEDMPEIDSTSDSTVVVYLGQDVESLPIFA